MAELVTMGVGIACVNACVRCMIKSCKDVVLLLAELGSRSHALLRTSQGKSPNKAGMA